MHMHYRDPATQLPPNSMVVLDTAVAARVREERARFRHDRFDEVWEGVYIVAPLANNEHQRLAYELAKSIDFALGGQPQYIVYPGTNVSDRVEGWTDNFRCPDVVVFLPGNPAQDCGTHWCGGPDFLVEILSPGDIAHDKLPFYASVNVREALFVDRDPWRLELYRLQGGQLGEVGRTNLTTSSVLASSVLPVSFALAHGSSRPEIVVTHTDGRTWRA